MEGDGTFNSLSEPKIASWQQRRVRHDNSIVTIIGNSTSPSLGNHWRSPCCGQPEGGSARAVPGPDTSDWTAQGLQHFFTPKLQLALPRSRQGSRHKMQVQDKQACNPAASEAADLLQLIWALQPCGALAQLRGDLVEVVQRVLKSAGAQESTAVSCMSEGSWL